MAAFRKPSKMDGFRRGAQLGRCGRCRMSKGLQTLRISFTDTHLTHFGGMVLLQRFCSRLGLRRLLKDAVPARLRSGSSAARPHPRLALRRHGRPAPDQQDGDPAIQRRVPLVAGAVPVPRPVHAPAVSQTTDAQRHPAPRGPARPAAACALSGAEAAHLVDLRSGFRRADRLRQTPIRPRRGPTPRSAADARIIRSWASKPICKSSGMARSARGTPRSSGWTPRRPSTRCPSGPARR